MKILHISKYYSPFVGGVENICKYLVERMPQHQTAVVCFNEGKKDVDDDVNGHKVWRVGSWLTIARQALSLSYFRVLHRAFREFKPDIVQFHWANPFPAFVLLTMLPKNVKLVVYWHMDIIRQKAIYPFIRPVETRLLRRADRVCVTSPNYRDASVPLRPFTDKVRVVVNGFDSELLKPHTEDAARVREIKEKYNGKPIVLFVGRHIPYKGLHHLVGAAEHVTADCAIVIAGTGPLTAQLKAMNRSDKVHFVGHLSDDDLRCHLQAADIFAFPSVTKNEAFGVALAEGMYMGLPPVTFSIDGSGVNWVSLKDVTGLEVDNGNEKLYAQALDRLIVDPQLRSRLGKEAKKRAEEHFTIQHMCEDMQRVYEELLPQ